MLSRGGPSYVMTVRGGVCFYSQVFEYLFLLMEYREKSEITDFLCDFCVLKSVH